MGLGHGHDDRRSAGMVRREEEEDGPESEERVGEKAPGV